jgi:hypothetical protein
MILADDSGVTVVLAAVFGGVGSVLLAFFGRSLLGLLKNFRAKRRVLLEASAIGLSDRLKALEDWKLEADAIMRRIVQFIEGSEDPYLKNADGTPVITGGLLSFMNRIEAELKQRKQAQKEQNNG